MTDEQIRKLLQAIIDLAAWHADLEADESDQSPDDMTAFMNGRIIKRCEAAMEELNHDA